MKLFTSSTSKRLNEVTGFLLLAFGLLVLLGLASYHVTDPSWDTAAGPVKPQNLTGALGAYAADVLLQAFGAAAFLLPVVAFVLGWKWMRSEDVEAPLIKLMGFALLFLSACAAAGLAPEFRVFEKAIPLGGATGLVVADLLKAALNRTGAIVVTATSLIVALYLVSKFSLDVLAGWVRGPVAFLRRLTQRAVARRKERALAYAAAQVKKREEAQVAAALKRASTTGVKPKRAKTAIVEPGLIHEPVLDELAPWEEEATADLRPYPSQHEPDELDGIPIRQLAVEEPVAKPVAAAPPRMEHALYRLPSTTLLNEAPQRSAFDEQELKNTAAAVKSKFEEFNVMGSVVQINPGPVVTTFEFKPDAGVKYSRITNLNEDLCLGLQAESIIIERIPGKPTVGIEVPNTKREVIALRQILESEEFQTSPSQLTISMGKDINGRIKVASLETMPHVLIAGSTGSGKSVMINSLVMSILYKATPDDVRMIMIDPKRVELGMYEGIPHLLTPVITDPRKATIALKNAVLEMERRLRLLAEHGARNIEQFNKKIRKMQDEPTLFVENPTTEELKPLPFILILIDELADLMMLEGRNVEESVTRLAQMARAVGMHLVLATQRPSVDVITGLIKANFPARISFRVATRVDSRTILDIMGAEHLLGKGDMLFLPPGSSRLTRVHGAFVTETEINLVVDFWKQQAKPEYDQSFLIAPPERDGEPAEDEPMGEQDPMYEEALRVVMEMGKASTSTLQRRLRLGYGRAARILDMMHRDGIIGPPDGSKPREVLKRPEWLREVEKA
jgi:S-DNA-T family DNA segregation ATPase FtsK/SpoIIIE